MRVLLQNSRMIMKKTKIPIIVMTSGVRTTGMIYLRLEDDFYSYGCDYAVQLITVLTCEVRMTGIML